MYKATKISGEGRISNSAGQEVTADIQDTTARKDGAAVNSRTGGSPKHIRALNQGGSEFFTLGESASPLQRFKEEGKLSISGDVVPSIDMDTDTRDSESDTSTTPKSRRESSSNGNDRYLEKEWQEADLVFGDDEIFGAEDDEKSSEEESVPQNQSRSAKR